MKNELFSIENQLLVMAAQEGDVEALEKLVRRWQKKLWRYVFRLTYDVHSAWDITQQCWLEMIKGLRKLNDPACFKAWAYRIATNKSIDWLKSKSKERHISLDSVEVDCNQRSVGFGAEELIQRLKDESRTVLSLYYFEQLTVSEISFALCIPAGTVKSRLHKAREELKEVWLRYCE